MAEKRIAITWCTFFFVKTHTISPFLSLISENDFPPSQFRCQHYDLSKKFEEEKFENYRTKTTARQNWKTISGFLLFHNGRWGHFWPMIISHNTKSFRKNSTTVKYQTLLNENIFFSCFNLDWTIRVYYMTSSSLKQIDSRIKSAQCCAWVTSKWWILVF